MISKHILTSISFLSIVAMSHASEFVWNFADHAGAVGSSSKSFTSTVVGGKSYDLGVYGYKNSTAAPKNPTTSTVWTLTSPVAEGLYEKYSSDAGETGLGLDAGGDHEVNNKSFIQLDLTKLQHHLKDLTIYVGSLQVGEGFDIWGSNTLGAPGQFIYSNHSDGTHSELVESYEIADINTYKYISISAWSSPNGNYPSGSNDICIRNGLSAVPTPEPAPFLGLGAGVLLLARKRRK